MARILILSYEFAPFSGGIATAVLGLATGAARLGHDAHVLAPDYNGDNSLDDATRPFTVHRFPGDFCSILSIDKLTRHARRVLRTVRQIRPDVVHAADPQSHMALTALARFGLARGYGVTVHGTELLRYRDEIVPRLWMRRAFARPAFIAPVSEAVRGLLLGRSDVDPARVRVVYPGIASIWIDRHAADRSVVRAAWDLVDHDRVIVTVARRVEHKGHLRVIAALSELPGEMRRRTAYIVIGRGPQDYARSLVRSAGERSVRLHLAGRLDDESVIDLLDASDLFVMLSESTPTRLEGLGLAYLEAGARGVPALAVATGGVAEAVKDGETGMVLETGADAGQVAAALSRLLADTGLRARLGNAARGHAAGFTWERHAAGTFGPLLGD